MTLARTAARLLEHRHGLRFDGAGERRLKRAVATLAAEGADPAAAEDRLLDLATLPESSWFRDPAAFAAVAARAGDAVARAAAEGGTGTLWSAGCANGQEAWSLAIALREAGHERFQVVASDVAPGAVRRAREGVYTAGELRGLTAARRARWLRPLDDGRFRVADELRAHVRVVRQSVAADAPPVPAAGAALVLCRYVLIYLTQDAAAAALDRIAGALAPGGLLVLGGGESHWQLAAGFRRVPLGPGAHGYAPRAEPVAMPAPRTAPRRPPATRRRRPAAAAPAAAPPSPSAADRLAVAERAAAAGDHAGAAAAFRHAAALDPGDPLAHLGLGLALEALGDAGAGRAFRAAHLALTRADATALREGLGGFRPEELARLLAEKAAGR